MNTIAVDSSVAETAPSELSASFTGELVGPGAPTYDEHRKVWNGSIDRYPALIARCAGAADVRAAVRFAGSTGLPVAVRGGGHSYPGLSVCDGGIVIDLGSMKGIRVDPKARTARVQAGALWGELDRETQAFGLATTGGIVTHTGVAGLTLGGGLGWLQRKHGLTIDQLLSVDLVTAGGELVKASHTENVDLFWGLRGGGGNFGIVTEFEFRLHPVGPTVLAGPIFWPIEQAPDLLRFYRDWSAEAPDELMTLVVQRKALPLPSIPRELHGKQLVSVSCCHAGPIEEGERVVRPLRAFGSPVLDLCEPKPYVAHQAMFDPAFPHGWRYYFRACDVAGLSDEVIDVMVEHGRRIMSPISSVAFLQMGGAVARVGESETAFNGRNAAFTVNINGNSETAEGFEAEREWARTAVSEHLGSRAGKPRLGRNAEASAERSIARGAALFAGAIRAGLIGRTATGTRPVARDGHAGCRLPPAADDALASLRVPWPSGLVRRARMRSAVTAPMTAPTGIRSSPSSDGGHRRTRTACGTRPRWGVAGQVGACGEALRGQDSGRTAVWTGTRVTRRQYRIFRPEGA